MTSYLSENEAKSPQNCDVHLANFEMGDLESHAFALIFTLNLFFDRSIPLSENL